MTAGAGIREIGLDPVAVLFERYRGPIYAYLYRLVGDPQWAEDLAQETFLRALAARRQLPQIENPRAWLYRIATNLAFTALKRRRRFAWLPWLATDDRRTEGPADDGERSAVEQALAALPPEYRAPLLLYAHYGLSVAKVGRALSLSQPAVKMRLCRAREMFRQVYERGEVR